MNKIITIGLRKVLTIFLCVVMVASCCTLATAGSDEISNSDSWQEKIDERLWSELQGKSDDDLIKAWIWQDEEPIAASVQTVMREEKGMDPAIYESNVRFNAEIAPAIILSAQNAAIATKNTNDIAQEKITAVKQNYTSTKLQVVGQEYQKANDLFVEKYVNTSVRNVSFVSKYTPSFTVQATKAEIIEYAKLNEVDRICFDEEAVCVPTGEVALEAVNADSTNGTKSERYNYSTGYKGRGVKIGIIEANGIYDPTNPQLCNLPEDRLQVIDNAGAWGTPLGCGVNAHATMVTNLIVGQAVTIDGKTYEGVAPEASVILTPVLNTDHLRFALEYLIGLECSVINMSLGILYDSDNHEYKSIDSYVDSLYYHTGVALVVAAGNLGTYQDSSEIDPETVNVSSPAKALNAITVGNAQTKALFATSIYGDVNADSLNSPFETSWLSSYNEAEYLPNKPDVSAPGTYIDFVLDSTTVGIASGTSFAAPIVSGIIAQMLESNANITPLDVKSILIAGAEYSKIDIDRNNTINEYAIDDYDVGAHLREISGAGLVNAVNSINIAKSTNGNTACYYVTSEDSVINAPIGMVLPGEKIRVAMTFRKTNGNDITSASMLDDVDLYLYNSAGSFLAATSASSVNNVEIVEYVAPAGTGGSFYCKLVLNQACSTSIPTYVTWFKWFPGDLNGNGTIETSDYLMLRSHINNGTVLTPEQEHVADVNRDGVLNLDDVTLIRNYILGYNVVLQ